MSSRSSPSEGKAPLGKLRFNPQDLYSLKCLAATRITKANIITEPDPTQKPDKCHFGLHDSKQSVLHDPFAISWFLANYDLRGKVNRYGPKIIQWNSFSTSEVKPFLNGLIKFSGPNPTRDVIHSNKLRKEHLGASLDCLNQVLMDSPFLAGDKFTLADVCMAVDLAPLLDPRLNGSLIGHPNFKDVMKKHFVYIRDWYALVINRPPMKFAFSQLTLHYPDEVPREKGDVSRQNQGHKANGQSSLIHQHPQQLQQNRRPSKGYAKPAKNNTRRKKSVGDEQRVDVARLKEQPLRILCLHGYRQNETSFREKLGAFRKIMGKCVDLTFITAPHRVLPMGAEDINQDQRGWWFSRENDYFKADDESDCDKGFDSSIEFIEKMFKLHGPFDGIMGFSQGAALAALLCLIKQRKPEVFPEAVDFKFAIMVAAFKSRSTKHASWYESNGEKIKMPTLHVMGYDDRVISKAMSEELLPLFEEPNYLNHAGGHFVPSTSKQKPFYLKFLEKAYNLCRPESLKVAAQSNEQSDENQNQNSKKEMSEKMPKDQLETNGAGITAS